MRKPNPRLKGQARTAVPAARDEVAAALHGEITRCLGWAAEQAEVLESIGAQSFSVACETYADANAAQLRHHAHRLRGLVLHALAVLVELQSIAGRLEALAAVRLANEALRPEEN